jgi:hypothetical protein
VRRILVIAFAAIQLVLAARIAIDVGMLPAEGGIADLVVPLSETLAAPIQGLADAVGIDFSGVPGAGIDPAIMTALIGWSIIEGIALLALSGPS